MVVRTATADATDWPQIAALYAELAKLNPSPVVLLNRAVAIGMTTPARVYDETVNGIEVVLLLVFMVAGIRLSPINAQLAGYQVVVLN